MKIQTSFCSLSKYSTIKELLQKELHLSSNLLKKHLPKNFLSKNVRNHDLIEVPLDLINNDMINSSYIGPLIEVLFEDETFIVVNKPFGIHGHPLEYSERATVLNFLRSKFEINFLSGRSTNSERGLLYRLDQETSGVLIFVKDESLHDELRQDFASLIKEKSYLAIVEGRLEIDREVIHFLEGSSRKGAIIKEDQGGQKCTSSMTTLKILEGFTLVKVRLESGFRHQIRAQLSLLGHPIAGDTLYGAKEADRLYLHALQYGLECRGEYRSFSAEKEKLFCDFLNTDSLLKVSR